VTPRSWQDLSGRFRVIREIAVRLNLVAQHIGGLWCDHLFFIASRLIREDRPIENLFRT